MHKGCEYRSRGETYGPQVIRLSRPNEVCFSREARGQAKHAPKKRDTFVNNVFIVHSVVYRLH
eukprot:6260059-Ditylum_brightwellii.AAC.1